MDTGTLVIFVRGATNLPKDGYFGPNPVCRLKMGDSSATTPAGSGRSPNWAHTVRLKYHPGQPLEISVLDTSSVSSKQKPLASGQHYPSPPGGLTAWETHVSLMSHIHGFNSGGQVSLRFELLLPQTSGLPSYPGAAPMNPYAQNNMYQAPQTGSFPQGYPGYPQPSPSYPQPSPSYPTATSYGAVPAMQHAHSTSYPGVGHPHSTPAARSQSAAVPAASPPKLYGLVGRIEEAPQPGALWQAAAQQGYPGGEATPQPPLSHQEPSQAPTTPPESHAMPSVVAPTMPASAFANDLDAAESARSQSVPQDKPRSSRRRSKVSGFARKLNPFRQRSTSTVVTDSQALPDEDPGVGPEGEGVTDLDATDSDAEANPVSMRSRISHAGPQSSGLAPTSGSSQMSHGASLTSPPMSGLGALSLTEQPLGAREGPDGQVLPRFDTAFTGNGLPGVAHPPLPVLAEPLSTAEGDGHEAFSPDTEGLLYQSPFANTDPVDESFGAGRGSQLQEAEDEAVDRASQSHVSPRDSEPFHRDPPLHPTTSQEFRIPDEPAKGGPEDMQRAQHAAKLASLSSKWRLTNLPDVKAWEIRREDIVICKRPDGSDHLLGSGAFGQVYKGMRGAEPVAVKIMTDVDVRAVKDFKREVAVLMGLHSSFIVQFLGASIAEQRMMLVTELLHESLHDALAAGRMKWYDGGANVALHIASALQYLEAHNIVHLDVKSPNILLTEGPSHKRRAKLGDVGLARTLQTPPTVSDALQGTFVYMAPEMMFLKPGQDLTTKADIFSYAVTLWEICTAEIPRRGFLRPLKAPEDAPPDVAALIVQCLEPEPEKRPNVSQILDILKPHEQHTRRGSARPSPR